MSAKMLRTGTDKQGRSRMFISFGAAASLVLLLDITALPPGLVSFVTGFMTLVFAATLALGVGLLATEWDNDCSDGIIYGNVLLAQAVVMIGLIYLLQIVDPTCKHRPDACIHPPLSAYLPYPSDRLTFAYDKDGKLVRAPVSLSRRENTRVLREKQNTKLLKENTKMLKENKELKSQLGREVPQSVKPVEESEQ